jgi:ParB family chromosome partitioning protein
VRKVEELAKAWQENRNAQPNGNADKPRNPYAASHDFDLLKNHLSAAFHTPVNFSCDRQGKGKITFQFSNEEDLTRLITLFDTLR